MKNSAWTVNLAPTAEKFLLIKIENLTLKETCEAQEKDQSIRESTRLNKKIKEND